MRKLWSDEAWEHYTYWVESDKKIAKKINELLRDIERLGTMKGKGKPEPLKHRKGYSRHIDHANRLVYDIEDGILYVFSCSGHYDE